MASATETVDNSLAALNLTGGPGNLQIWGRGSARAKLQQPRAAEREHNASNDGQKKCRTRARPFQKTVLAAPGANTEPGKQGCDNDLRHKINCLVHHVSLSKTGNTSAIASKGALPCNFNEGESALPRRPECFARPRVKCSASESAAPHCRFRSPAGLRSANPCSSALRSD